jgi:hypothetical protein
MMTTHVDLVAATELARLAPSVHNTQPWRFRIDGDDLLLGRDPARRLDVLDPTGRQQVISCGAALYLACIALRLQGFDVEVELLPDADDPDLLARLVPVPGHLVSEDDVVLAQAARRRHTQRGRFEARPVPRGVVSDIRTAAQELGAWVRVLDQAEDVVALAVLLSQADQAEREDPAYQEELARWTRRPAGASDGIPGLATPSVHGRASSLRLRDFLNEEEAAGVPTDTPSVAEHPLALVIGTALDGPADWLRAGQALMALLLRGVVDGVQAQPLGQVVDNDWSRTRLGMALGVIGHPQMVLRMGFAAPGPDTPRRPVRDVLDSA